MTGTPEPGPDPYVPHRGTSTLRVEHYELELDYRPSTNALSGRAVLTVVVLEPLDVVQLDLVGLGVDRVLVDGRRPRRFRQREDKLLVQLDEAESPGARLQVEVRWSGSPGPQDGPWGEVGWEELTDGVIVAGQPDGAPTWFPCNDVPSDKATYRTTVHTDSAYDVVATGLLVARRTGGSRTSWTYLQDLPTATYLATLQLGRYERHALPRGSLLVTPPHLRGRALADTQHLPAMHALFARCFGPYPFPTYTVVVADDDLEIPLEAQGLAVFGANHVDGAGGSERLVAHELAHQWFGNSVGVAAWRHVWLNEGPACYAEWLWSEESGGPSADELARRWHRRLAALPQDLVLSDPGPERMFDDRLYKRGALALHALRRTVGDGAFFDLLRGWTAARSHSTATTDDFLAHTGAGDLLRPWVDLTPLPDLPG